MTTKHISILCFMLLILNGCNTHKKDTGKIELTPFASFIKNIAQAKFSDYTGKQGVKVKDEAAFNEMANHILKMYEGVTAEHSFFGRGGEIVDCIPYDQQPAVRNDASLKFKTRPVPPPLYDTGKAILPKGYQAIDLSLKKGMKDTLGNEMYCPDGYIPMMRLSLDQMVSYATLHDFFMRGRSSMPHAGGGPN